ncbi:type VI secretion system tube protein TssD [Vibrio sp. PP-XX7]
MGNRYQETHTDQITVLACNYSMMKRPQKQPQTDDVIQITKHIDKSTPLLATAFARQEHLEGTIDFYRTNERGHNEKFYSITLQKALITGINSSSPHATLAPYEEMNETISLKYKGVQWEHHCCGTLGYEAWESNALSHRMCSSKQSRITDLKKLRKSQGKRNGNRSRVNSRCWYMIPLSVVKSAEKWMMKMHLICSKDESREDIESTVLVIHSASLSIIRTKTDTPRMERINLPLLQRNILSECGDLALCFLLWGKLKMFLIKWLRCLKKEREDIIQVPY